METCRLNFNLYQLTVLYMKGRLAKKTLSKQRFLLHELIAFRTCHFVKFESKRSFKLCKLYLLKENSYDICKYFLTFVSADLLCQMTGLSLFVKKLI